MKLKDKVAIVTGGAKGIGWGISKILIEKGAKVAVVDWDEEAGHTSVEAFTADGAEALFIKCDVSDEGQVKAMIDKTLERFGRIDILVNNAGIGMYKTILDTSAEEWDLCQKVNLKGTFLCSKYAIPHMQEIGKGAIVNISSVHSRSTANGVAPYSSTKGGITALTRGMAIDYGPVIRVNAVAPGWVLTPMIKGIFAGYEDPAGQRKIVEDRQVMKRIGRPEDIGYAVAFLASDEASFITGTQLFVDGGLTCQLEVW
jgi:NAD(P)-dependent dehydrogenase (short-subunit alcohol dehydrogenase family)